MHWYAICNKGGRHYNAVIDVLQLILNVCIGIMKLLINIYYRRRTQSLDEGLYEIMEHGTNKTTGTMFCTFVLLNISTTTHTKPRRRETLVNYLISVDMRVLKLYYRFSFPTSSQFSRGWKEDNTVYQIIPCSTLYDTTESERHIFSLIWSVTGKSGIHVNFSSTQ